MSFPETTFTHDGYRFRVWATSADHIGFDAGYAHNDLEIAPLTINGVSYLVRFDAERVNGQWRVLARRNTVAGKEYTYHWDHMYMTRANPHAWKKGVTDAAKKRMIKLANETLAAFIKSPESNILCAGERADAKIQFRRATTEQVKLMLALKEAEETYQEALRNLRNLDMANEAREILANEVPDDLRYYSIFS